MSLLSTDKNRTALAQELSRYVYHPEVIQTAIGELAQDDPKRRRIIFQNLVFLRLLVVSTAVSLRFPPEEGMPFVGRIMEGVEVLTTENLNPATSLDFFAGYTRIMPRYFERLQNVQAHLPEVFCREAAPLFAELCGEPGDQVLLLVAVSGLTTWLGDMETFFSGLESGELRFEGMDAEA